MKANQVKTKTDISVTYKAINGIDGNLDNEIIKNMERIGAIFSSKAFDMRLSIRELCFTLQLKGDLNGS
jgi:hypothetical protein